MEQRTPLSGREYAAVQSLFAAVSTFKETVGFLEKRARAAGDGTWRDLCMLGAKTDRIMESILRTVPEPKLRQVLKEIQNVKLYIRVEPPGLKSMPDKTFSYVPTEALNDILAMVTEYNCMTCDRTATEARHCEVRKALNDILPHDLPGKDGEYCRMSGVVLGIEET